MGCGWNADQLRNDLSPSHNDVLIEKIARRMKADVVRKPLLQPQPHLGILSIKFTDWMKIGEVESRGKNFHQQSRRQR